jgi:hypothetical protein
MFITVFEIWTEVRSEQDSNADSPMDIRLSDIVIERREVQPEKTAVVRCCSPCGSCTERKEEQARKALLSIWVTVDGIDIEDKDEQEWKVDS